MAQMTAFQDRMPWISLWFTNWPHQSSSMLRRQGRQQAAHLEGLAYEQGRPPRLCQIRPERDLYSPATSAGATEEDT